MPSPVPAERDVLIKVHATTVSRTDLGLLHAEPFLIRFFMGWSRPRITTLGLEFAGEVLATGSCVSRFRPGDRVFGLSSATYGGHAEQLCLSEAAAIAHLPPDLRYQDAVCAEGVWYAHAAPRVPSARRRYSSPNSGVRK